MNCLDYNKPVCNANYTNIHKHIKFNVVSAVAISLSFFNFASILQPRCFHMSNLPTFVLVKIKKNHGK